MPHPQPITASIHHHCLPSREERSALSGEVATRGPRSLCPAPAREGCLLSLRSCRCVRTGKAGGGSAPYLPAGEGCAPRPRPRPHPWAGGPGTPRRVPSPGPRARASALTGNRGVECGPRGGGRTHIPGVSALRAQRRARRGERCPSVSLRTGTGAQLRLSGNAAADADPARGAGRNRGGGRARRGDARGGGCPGLEATQQVALPGLGALRPRATPLLGLPLPPQQPPTLVHLPTRRGRILPPLLGRGPLADSRKSFGC